MELTNILGVSFQINADSVVYAYSNNGGSTLLLSKGSVLVSVEETVAEIVTASAGNLVAFTALSGDKTGDIAVNPNYIQSVSSYNSGNDSQISICDNTSVRATVVVDTAYADMDAIIEASGGSASYLVYTALLSQSGTDAPVATVLENTLGGTVVWTYAETGVYTATLAGAFPTSKTGIFFGNTNSFSMNAYRVSDNAVNLSTIDSNTSAADGYLNDTIIEIRVYP